MAFSQIIKTLQQPSIKLTTLSDYDTSSDSQEKGIIRQGKSSPDSSQSAGALIPTIKIAGKTITVIESMTIDETGFIPTFTLIFKDNAGEFAGNNFPKRNLIASVYIAVSNEKLKPVRSDYLITSVKSIPISIDSAGLVLGNGTTYIIKGILFVPRIYNNVSKSYPNLNSIDALKKVCSELGLGYAQNEFTTNDFMTWININTSPMNFMKEITNYAYQDELSFFNGFINKEMIFNFINVNEQLKQLEADQMFLAESDPIYSNLTQRQKDLPIKGAISETTNINYLTNRAASSGKPNYIIEANLISDQGAILKSDGYLKKIYYYDHFEPVEIKEGKLNKFKDFYTAPLNTEGSEESNMLTPDDEGLAEIGNKKWMNINYGNTHQHWNAARVFNTHNLKELEKIKLRAVTKGINFQVIRGASIPVFLTLRLADAIRKEADLTEVRQVQEKEKLSDETLDTQLSGRYYVSGVKYHYDPTTINPFSTEFFLARREWLPSKIIFTANA
jgi:hypothetical protein